MPSYVFLAVAAIVIIAICVVGMLLFRRGRHAAEEDLSTSEPALDDRAQDQAAAPDAFRAPSGAQVVVEPIHAEPVAETSGATAPLTFNGQAPPRAPEAAELPGPASEGQFKPESELVPAVKEDDVQGVEQLLAEWRARHEPSPVRGSGAGARPATGESKPGQGGMSHSDPAALDASAEAPALSTDLSSLGPPPPIPAEPSMAHGAAAFSSVTARPSLSVFDAAEHEVCAADLAVHAVLLDPLGVVILDIVDGSGGLSTADLKRLEVFQPESIQLAVTTLELPPRLRQDEDAVLRLAQVQLHAAALELRSKWSGKAPERRGRSTDAPYSARDFKLKIARDVMDLPVSDRLEVIGYVLGELLTEQNSTRELKRAVIDTLENLRSAVLADVLLDCLDDPDPIVQEYALAAADRLLDG